MTVYDELTAYCREKELNIPEKQDRQLLGHQVARAFRQQRNVKELPRVASQETLYVTSYPEDFQEETRKIIEGFMTLSVADRHRLRSSIKPKKLRFNFDVPVSNATTFERILEKKGFAINKNFQKQKTAQYRIEYINPADLIHLGMAFYKNIGKPADQQLDIKQQP